MNRDFAKEDRVYRILYTILSPFLKLFFRPTAVNFDKMPDGAAIICANHSDGWDPLIFLCSVGKDNNIRFMVKKEFENFPLVGFVLKKMGEIFVDRKANDIKAIKETLYNLKSGLKVFIFPEGTRTEADGSVDPKKGALKIATKVNCPVVPVFIPRNKKLFSPVRIIMGEPYYVTAKTQEEFEAEATMLMEKIFLLAEDN